MQSLEKRLSEWIFETDIDHNKDIYLVGGCVRDILLERPSQDIDLTCSNARQFAYDLAKKKRAVCVVMDKKPQVPCFRLINRQSPDNYIDITEIRGDSIESDLKQRDFTVNAMALLLKPGAFQKTDIIDTVKGKKDLERKIIRQVCNEAFIEDPLRMLRAFRFSAQLGFTIDSETITAIQTHAKKIKTISAERILFELKLLLRLSDVSKYIEQMDQANLLTALFPEVESLKNCSQNDYHHTHVWGHSLEALKAYEQLLVNVHTLFQSTTDQVLAYLNQNENMALIKLACLFHDIAKPDTRNVDPETNRVTFYRHDQLGKEQIEKICDRLRLSKRNAAFVCTLVEEHLHIRDLLKPGTRKKTILRSIRKTGENIVGLALLSIADQQASCGIRSTPEDRQAYRDCSIGFIESYYNDVQPVISKKNLITGKDLIVSGVQPGPMMGKILRQVRDAQDEGKIETSDQALALVEELIKNDIQV
ncbi:MAG: HD domain-containing protein [Candidatus Magnetomorum sp.]|nr:HD domain-containing protein [Candidatus Magnetomorum sp.]